MDHCPMCGGPLVWSEGTSKGWLHAEGCTACELGIPVSIRLGDGESFQVGTFTVEEGETPEENLATFLHATSMLMMDSLGHSPATHCMEPAMKASRANN